MSPLPPHSLQTPSDALQPDERTYRWVEFIVLFFVLPALFCFRSFHVPLPILLLSAGICCWIILGRDRTFDREQLWNLPEFFRGLPRVLGLWLVGAAMLAGGVLLLAPEKYLDFPRQQPGLWMAVMILYPLVSVYPQNIVYRVVIFHRYEPLFRSRNAVVWASALAFCFGHIIFQNWLAMGLTFVGGIIFANTYSKYRSALLVSFEHALFGCLVFTVGMGQSLYLAAVRAS